MMTVREVSRRTGVSVRTLHYYDEIGLLRPTVKTEAGYRLYDADALATLGRILFFREFDLPLKAIRAILYDPALDPHDVLRLQRQMLREKADRLRRQIANIDSILKGEDDMDFTVFQKSERETLFQLMTDRMPEAMRAAAEAEFGGLNAWRAHYLEKTGSETMQKGYQKIVEWYGGDKAAAFEGMAKPRGEAVVQALQNRIDAILEKLAAKAGGPTDTFEVKSLVGEYGFVMKRFYQIGDEAGVMRAVAKSYRDPRAQASLDARFGEGAAAFFAAAIEGFYPQA